MGACSFGATVKPGEPTWYYVTDADLDNWFGTWNPTRLAFEIFNGRAYNLAELAAANPDVPPARGWSDFITAFLGGGRYGVVGGIAGYGADLIGYLVFKEHCQCNGGSGGAGWGPWITSPDVYYDGGGGVWGPMLWASDVAIPAGATQLKAEYTTQTPPNDSSHYVYAFQASHAGGGSSSPMFSLIGGGPWGPFTLVNTAIYNYVNAEIRGGGHTFGIRIAFYLPSVPIPPSAPPAPGAIDTTGRQVLPVPSGTTTDQLAQEILRLQTAVDTYGAVIQLLQERLSPLSYAAGATHAVSGTGQIAVDNLLGIAVSFTSVPARLPVESGTPDNIWQLGRISFGTPEGWQRNITLTHDPDLLLPVSAFITKIGYTFPVGVAAIITELKAAN